ncbi:hypothetical protein FDP41_010751 [Naegleria fowleri]|uniref:Uncharacterized protein n=1 Tax=Naegleria fowleri TaxID=5763 RepID=A0A6A5C7C6_NAEFO|nr:uncharacterized protein FDP41_010751 [Naegleria fowleri]KAF0982772.1 hypothetical protein FDP41_010751 [Naegleria fowleri]
MAQNIIYSCWGLAEELLSGGRVIDSIKTLECLLSSVGFDRERLYEVETRVRLSQIYLKYTRNFNSCKNHLLSAGLVLKSIIEQVTTSIEVYYLDPSLKITTLQIQIYKCLGSVYTQMNEFPSACEAYMKGIDFVESIIGMISKKKNPSTHEETLKTSMQAWRHYFRIALLHTLEIDNFMNDRRIEIQQQLDLGEKEENELFKTEKQKNTKTINKRILAYYIIRVYQAIKQDHVYVPWSAITLDKKNENISTYLTKIHEEIGVEMGSDEEKKLLENPINADVILLYLNYLIMSCLYKMSLGDLASFKSILKSIQDSVAKLQVYSKNPAIFTYEWIEIPPIVSTIWLIASLYYRTQGQFAKSEGFNTKGIATADKYIKELANAAGFALDKKRNDNTLFSLFVKFNLLQDMILIHLSRSEFILATKNMIKLIDFIYQFPDLFITYRHNIHLLIGILLFFTDKERGADSACNQHFEFIIKNCPSKQLVTWATIFQIFWKLNCSESVFSTKDLFKDVDDLTRSLKTNGLREVESFQSYISFIKGVLCLRNNALDESKNHFQKSLKTFDQFSLSQKSVIRQCMLGILQSDWKLGEHSKQKTLEQVTKLLQESKDDQDLFSELQSLSFLMELSSSSTTSLKASTSNHNTAMDTSSDFDIDNIRLSQPEPISHEFDQAQQRLADNIQTLLTSNTDINTHYEILKSWFPDVNKSYKSMMDN